MPQELRNHLRSDEEILEAIRRGQAEMSPPEGWNEEEFHKKLVEDLRNHDTGVTIFYALVKTLFSESHPELWFWEVNRFFRKERQHMEEHIKECEKCQVSLRATIDHLTHLLRQQ